MLKALLIVWTLPNTLLGLGVAVLALRGGCIRIVDGVIEARGPILYRLLSTCLPLRGIAALTLGHVVIARDEEALSLTRLHERVHVHQYERWGVLFLPAYLLASVAAVLRGEHYYHGNIFEQEAVRAAALPSTLIDKLP